jgi:nicotinate-nucleotide--dimethylbenzimidazole phosphoribosyltransferase
MESSDDQDTTPTSEPAQDASGAPDDAQFDQAASAQDWVAASDSSAGPAASAENTGAGDAQESDAGASDPAMSSPWYPVVGAIEPVASAVEPVPGSGVSVSPNVSPGDSSASASVPVVLPGEQESAAEGPVWPEAPQAVDAEALAMAATAPDEDPAASSGAWPEPPTPWADSGAIAAVGAVVASAAAAEAPAEAQAPEAAATPQTPGVSELPTAVNAQQVEPPPVAAAPPPTPEPPPAYTPSLSAGYPTPAQPLYPQASAYVAPQARPSDSTPVIVEAILAFFGFYGIGWLIARETTIGVILLIAGFVWDAIFIAAAFTVIGLCCVVPLQLIFVALSAFQLNNRLHMRA